MNKIYIAGKITGDPGYRAKFAAVEKRLERDPVNVVINPAVLPKRLDYVDYMNICHAMLNAADRVVFMQDYRYSEGACLEMQYCLTVHKPFEVLPVMDPACTGKEKSNDN
jgi:hypothetical protein